ncbi:MAG: M1 family metallopeptidase [Anaerolineales bacterium]
MPTIKRSKLQHLTIIFLAALILAACNPAPLPPTATPAPAAHSPSTLSPVAAPPPTASPTPLSPTATPIPSPAPSPSPTPSSGGLSAGDPYAPELGNTGYDVQHYTIQLQLDPSKTLVEGVTTIEAASDVHNLVGISLDFAGFEISELTVDGDPAGFSRQDGKLLVDLPRPLSAGETFSVQIAYHGSPTTESSPYVPFVHHLGLQFLGSSLFAVAEPDGAHYWFPSNDHPRDKATFRFEVAVPEGLTAVANGLLVDVYTAENTTTFVWEHDFPMATYLATVAVGEYERVESYSPDGVLLRHYVFPDLWEEFEQAASVTGEAIDWMGEIFGPYPFEAFGFVTIRVVRASLETQTMVILSENMLNEETVIHEITHIWFGDWVSMESWADMWHNEGFAIYISLMWQTRDNPETLNYYMQNLTAKIRENDTGNPLGDLPPQRLFGYDSYNKGAAMIHALRLEVGDEAFFSGLRLYFERYGGGTASREEFIEVMEEASGLQLDAFFEAWLE